MSLNAVAEGLPPRGGAPATDLVSSTVAPRDVMVMTAERVDRACHDALKSHYDRHPDIAVVLVVDLVGAHDIVAVAPYGVAAMVRTAELCDDPDLLKSVKALATEGGHRLPIGMGSSIRTAAAEPTRQQTLGQPGVLLKPLEVDVLVLVAEGLTRTGIARRLGRTPEQVRSTLKNIFGRPGVHQRAEAVAYAARAGLLWALADREAR
ncbi:helix-turn-helix transcriptional regulator [Streptomyces sp. NPDC002920]